MDNEIKIAILSTFVITVFIFFLIVLYCGSGYSVTEFYRRFFPKKPKFKVGDVIIVKSTEPWEHGHPKEIFVVGVSKYRYKDCLANGKLGDTFKQEFIDHIDYSYKKVK